jgi:uncharacterized protein
MTSINKDIWVNGSEINDSSAIYACKRVLKYDLNDKVVMINGLTGAIDFLSANDANDLVANPLRIAKRNPILFKELGARGYLFNEKDGEINLEKKLLEYIEKESEKKEMVFMMCPTDFCPVGCSYCFAEERVLEANRDVMKPEMIDSAFESISEILKRYPSRLSTMCLYGGEPFQEFTAGALEQIFHRSAEMGLRIAGFTSGVYTYKFRDLLTKYKSQIQTIAVTLDGSEFSHEAFRKMGKSYEKAIKTIDMLIEIGVPVLVKSNVNRTNIKDLPRLVDMYKKRGWWTNPLVKYELTPIQYKQISLERDTNFDLEMAFEFFEMKKINPDLEKFDILPMADNKYSLLDGFGFHKFPKENVPLQAAVPRIHSCPSYSKHFFVFSADGNFYLCNEEVGIKESSFGSFSNEHSACSSDCTSHSIDYEKMEEYYKRDVCGLSPCANCSYAFLCGGGCGHHAGGEDLAICGTIHQDIGEIIRRWANIDELPKLPLTGVQQKLGELVMKTAPQCKTSTKDLMRVAR